jgi:hypothetical protein
MVCHRVVSVGLAYLRVFLPAAAVLLNSFLGLGGLPALCSDLRLLLRLGSLHNGIGFIPLQQVDRFLLRKRLYSRSASCLWPRSLKYC